MGGLLLAASVAWACTLHIGTLTVCSPPTATGSYSTGSQCSKITGSGTAQTGLASVKKAGTSAISVKVSGFYNKNYSLTFRVPGSTANCHRGASPTNANVKSLLGYQPTPPTGPIPLNTVPGPSFVVGIGAGSSSGTGGQYATVKTPATLTTGSGQICTQDEPNVVDGNMLNVSVI